MSPPQAAEAPAREQAMEIQSVGMAVVGQSVRLEHLLSLASDLDDALLGTQDRAWQTVLTRRLLIIEHQMHDTRKQIDEMLDLVGDLVGIDTPDASTVARVMREAEARSTCAQCAADDDDEGHVH